MTRTESPFEGLKTVQIPAELRKRTLDKARSAINRPPLPDLWARIWYGWSFRFVWAAAAVVLISAHLVISTASRLSSGERPMPSRIVSAAADSELAAVIELPHITARLPRIQMETPDSNENLQTQTNSNMRETQS